MRVYRLKREGQPVLGISGENEAAKIEVDAADFAEEFPGGIALLVYARPDGQVYPLISETDENHIVSAMLTSLETEKPGYVEIELQWLVGDVLAKSRAYRGRIRESVGTSTTPPSPTPAWADQVIAAGQAAQEALEQIGETIDTELERAKESGEFTPHYTFSMTADGVLEYEEVAE